MADSAQSPDKLDYGSKKTKNTKAWWQAKADWSSDEYEQRRQAIIARIRDKWPEEKMLNGRDGSRGQQKREVREWLRPLVITFNDTNWPYGATTENRIERQLQYYVSWALYLNRTFHYSPTPATAPSHSILTSDQVDSRSPQSRLSMAGQTSTYWSDSSSDNETERLEVKSSSRESLKPPVSRPVSIKREQDQPLFSWDNVELRIDATELNMGEVWLPMIDLKPGNKHAFCHWADFNLASLYTSLSAEAGVIISPNTHKFVYLNSAKPFEFYREGAYRIILKRFSQAFQPDDILQFQILRHTPQTRTAVARRPNSYLTPPETARRTDNVVDTHERAGGYHEVFPPHSSSIEHAQHSGIPQSQGKGKYSAGQGHLHGHHVDVSARSAKRQKVGSGEASTTTRNAGANGSESRTETHINIEKDPSVTPIAVAPSDTSHDYYSVGNAHHDTFFMPRAAEAIVFSETNSPSTEPLSATPEPQITKLEQPD